MRFGSLFAGIGGFDLGLERAGMECAWQVEIDPFCQQVLAKHWPDIKRYSDVRECGKHNLEPVELICGGFPCQPHSVAGKRRGAADDRDLWPEYRRIVEELRPRWVLAENVPGIRTTILDQVLSDLDNLGYTTGTLNIPAVAFDAPHIRERILIVAHANGSAIREQRDDEKARNESKSGGDIMADPEQSGCRCSEAEFVTYIECGSMEEQGQSIQSIYTTPNKAKETNRYFDGSWWAIEPPVGRVANGVPRRVDRLRSLGNAVVPQVVEWIGRQIMEVENGEAHG